MRWLAVVTAAYALNLFAVVGLHQGLHVNVYVAQLGGVAVYTTAAFLGGRYFAFHVLRQTTSGRAA